MKKLRTILMGAIISAGLAASPTLAGENVLTWSENMPKTLDPHAVYDVLMQGYMLNTYDSLYRYQGNPPVLKPWLAESHTVSADGKTWTFKIRSGVKFHDGSTLTADDVVYSFNRLLKMGKAPSGAFRSVLKPENVKAVNGDSVQFVLTEAYAPFLSAIPMVAIVNPRVLKAHEKDNDHGTAWLSSNEAGSGAFIADPASFRPLEKLDLKRFKDHFMGWSDIKKPLDMVRMRPIQETSTRVLALLKGETDAFDSYLPVDQVARVEKNPTTRVSRDESMRLYLIRMNNTKPPFDNINARKCFAHAFKANDYIKKQPSENYQTI